ncbi:MAG: hypothetical protein ACK5MV_00185 [Aminipila sp.]
MAKRNPIKGICIELVRTDDKRREHIERLKAAKEDLTMQLGGGSSDGQPRGSNTSNPVERINLQIEALEFIINDEQRRVDAVEAAREHIGWQYDIDIQQAMQNDILKNVKHGYELPFRYLKEYPFGDQHFYLERAHFLSNIAKYLNLTSRY